VTLSSLDARLASIFELPLSCCDDFYSGRYLNPPPKRFEGFRELFSQGFIILLIAMLAASGD